MFGDRRGALVALDPKTGDVLAFVSKPTFDPNLFVDGIDTESWQALRESLDKPLLNRALRGTYPPGSTYKPFMAHGGAGNRQALAQQVDERQRLLGFRRPRVPQPRRRRWARSTCTVHRQVQQPITTRWPTTWAWTLIHDFMKPLGFGQITGIDIGGELAGVLPSHRLEARGLQKSGPRSKSGTPAKPFRWASARATTPSPCCSWRRPRRCWPTTASSASRAWSSARRTR
jgi:penicillin-binding protein 2